MAPKPVTLRATPPRGRIDAVSRHKQPEARRHLGSRQQRRTLALTNHPPRWFCAVFKHDDAVGRAGATLAFVRHHGFATGLPHAAIRVEC